MKKKKALGREAMILIKRRKEMGLTQSDVAEHAGISLQHYQLYEYGTRKVSSGNMMLGLKICAALELEPYEFVFENSSDWVRRTRKP
ncbi:MAG: helix-turn-helix transcriptional regulator [Ruminococcus sp.]|nr:helix-turn-helix transcriptional regulator [Ruminococcus sp.]